MYLWTKSAMDVWRNANEKAESMKHQEVLPLHLLWAANSHMGLERLRLGRNDARQAKLRYQLDRELSKIPTNHFHDATDYGLGPVPGRDLQQTLLRAADFAQQRTPADVGAVSASLSSSKRCAFMTIEPRVSVNASVRAQPDESTPNESASGSLPDLCSNRRSGNSPSNNQLVHTRPPQSMINRRDGAVASL